MAMSACSSNKQFSLTDSSVQYELFCHKYIIFIAKWVVVVYVSFDYVYSISNENWKHCALDFFWYLFDVKIRYKT